MRELDYIAQAMMFDAIQIGLAVLLSWWLVHRLRTVAYRRGYRDALAASTAQAPLVYSYRIPASHTGGETHVVRGFIVPGAPTGGRGDPTR